jgi:hypothetical protein
MNKPHEANAHAYNALMGSIFGTAKPVDENPVTQTRASIWLHENFTDDEIWGMYDTIKWEQELETP